MKGCNKKVNVLKKIKGLGVVSQSIFSVLFVTFLLAVIPASFMSATGEEMVKCALTLTLVFDGGLLILINVINLVMMGVDWLKEHVEFTLKLKNVNKLALRK